MSSSSGAPESPHGSSETHLGGPASDDADSGDTDSFALARAPVRLGRHVLLHELGRGGMGVVYAAYDETLDRRVAIKLLRSGGERAQRRLVREAQALARLSHPNVVQIYEI